MLIRRDRLTFYLIIGCIIFLLLLINTRQRQPKTLVENIPYGRPAPAEHCLSHPLAKDVVLVMKTGASEINERLPVHFNTTFRCAHDYLVFSDVAQEFQGIPVYDSLDDLHTWVKPNHPDFNYYRDLQEAAKNGTDVTGFNTQAAWDLDKWKNVPILRKALAMRPDAKWFLFVDADTAITWTNLLTWISKMSPDDPHYIGAQIWIGDIEFAHGGSGYLVSQAAAKRVAAASKDKMTEWMNFVQGKCCGDLVIGKVFKDVEVPVTRAWPNINGETPQSLDYTINHWCFAAVTWHHMSPEQTIAMYEYDKEVMGKMVSLRLE
jgi:Fringe-like